MNYLFFDMEYATCKGGVDRVCEFGYIVVDENYKVTDRGNLIINPNIARFEWDYWAVKNILTRKIEQYEAGEKFDYYYLKIRQLIESSDLIIGHTLSSDAKAINDECRRYSLDPINFKFYDVKEMYKVYTGKSKNVSVVDILRELNIQDESVAHDAENDAYKTMIALKKIVENMCLSIQKLIEQCPSAEDYSKDFKVESIERNNAERKQKAK